MYMKKFLFFFLVILFQGLNAAETDVALEPIAPVIVDEQTPMISDNENQDGTQVSAEEDDQEFTSLTEVITDALVNAYATVKHEINEGVDAIVSPLSAGKQYVVTSLQNEFGQEKYYAHLAPAAVVLGAKNIQMLFAFLTHIALMSEDPNVRKFKVNGYSVPLQELYEQVYQAVTKDVLNYEQKSVTEKIAKIVPEVGVIALWHLLANIFLVDKPNQINGVSFEAKENIQFLLQGQLANTLDGSIDDFLGLDPEQIVFGLTKALLRGATVFARRDVQDADFELTPENLKQAGAEALLPILIDGCVNKVPLGLTQVHKKRLESILNWVSKTVVRQVLFP
jgi:hypothetical protein